MHCAFCIIRAGLVVGQQPHSLIASALDIILSSLLMRCAYTFFCYPGHARYSTTFSASRVVYPLSFCYSRHYTFPAPILCSCSVHFFPVPLHTIFDIVSSSHVVAGLFLFVIYAFGPPLPLFAVHALCILIFFLLPSPLYLLPLPLFSVNPLHILPTPFHVNLPLCLVRTVFQFLPTPLYHLPCPFSLFLLCACPFSFCCPRLCIFPRRFSVHALAYSFSFSYPAFARYPGPLAVHAFCILFFFLLSTPWHVTLATLSSSCVVHALFFVLDRRWFYASWNFGSLN